MRNHPALSLALTLIAAGVDAQRPAARSPNQRVRLSSVLVAFLVDSGMQTRGLPWTTGSQLPIKWASAGPVANPNALDRGKGLTRARGGTFTGTVGDSVALPMAINMVGTATGLARLELGMASMEVTLRNGSGYFVTREMVEQALKNEELTFLPLKCTREKEGASYGNLVDAVKAPGKTASGLWWYWDSPQQRTNLMLTILYRRADMAQVECQSE